MVAGNWDAYWRNARSAAAHRDGGPQDKVLERFWLQLFDRVFPSMQAGAASLDIACGNGAVPRFALASLQNLEEDRNLHICGLDESGAALQEMCKRDPALNGIAASALQLPFRDGSFELVTSQFGMEYAGVEAFAEAIRVLGPGGHFAAVLHMRDGGIYRECDNNLQAIDGFRNSSLLDNFRELFREVVKTRNKGGNKEHIRRIDKNFAASVVAVEEVLKRRGRDIAGGTLIRVYTDIGHMYRRLNAYDAEEMFNWLEVMSKELETYSGRMTSMLAAALDEGGFENVLAQLAGMGVTIRIQDTLIFGQQGQPSAWVLVAGKSPGEA